jgi:hypothetical protein
MHISHMCISSLVKMIFETISFFEPLSRPRSSPIVFIAIIGWAALLTLVNLCKNDPLITLITTLLGLATLMTVVIELITLMEILFGLSPSESLTQGSHLVAHE